jgi:hypothetical protein
MVEPNTRALVLALAASIAATAALAESECRPGPRIVGDCFWLHGRLDAWNGNPTFRIWRVGGKRILGLDSAGDPGSDPRPPAVINAMSGGADAFSTSVWGDYRVCPFTRVRPGRMQFVCIAKADHLVARPR